MPERQSNEIGFRLARGPAKGLERAPYAACCAALWCGSGVALSG